MGDYFDKAFEVIILHEGGYADDPYDSGGETMYGITKEVARRYGYKGEMWKMPLETAEVIYREEYWDRIRIPDFNNDTLKLMLFDTAVNMGQPTAIRKLQKAYNLLHSKGKEIAEDGIVGPQTINSANSYERIELLKFCFCIVRGERYLDIVRSRNNQTRFIAGWLYRLKDMVFRIGE